MTIHPNIYRTLAPGPVVGAAGLCRGQPAGGQTVRLSGYGGPTGTRPGRPGRGDAGPGRPAAGSGPRPDPHRGGQRRLCSGPGPGGADQRPPGLPGHARQHPRRPPGTAVGAGGPAALLPCPGGVGGGPALAETWAARAGLVLHRLAGL